MHEPLFEDRKEGRALLRSGLGGDIFQSSTRSFSTALSGPDAAAIAIGVLI